MLTGTIPPYHAVRDNADHYLDEVYTTLPEILRGQGFATAAIVSAFVLDSRFGLDQGFDRYDDEFGDPEDSAGTLERRGGEVTARAIDWLEQHRDEKGFLFLHYFDPHKEYDAPEPWGSKFASRPYLGEIAYTDDCIGKVVQKLKELGIYDSTLLVVTSDHGEMLGEHGEETHTYFIYQGAVHVPLIVKLPGSAGAIPGDRAATGARRISAVVGVVDVTPTICGLLGIEMPAPVQGSDLSSRLWDEPPADLDRPRYCESMYPTRYDANPLFGLVTSRWKFIHSTRPELYDLQADPGETNNLVDELPDRADVLLGELEERLQLEPPSRKGDRSTWDEQAARRLNSLGYVGSSAHVHDFAIDPARADAKDMIATAHRPTMRVVGHVKHREFAKARKICAQLVRQHPGFSDGHSLMGKIAMGERQYEEAAGHWSRSLAIQPDDPIAHNRLGLCRWELGDARGAIESVRRALVIDADFSQAQGNLGRFLVQQGQLDEGIVHLRRAVDLKPDFGAAHKSLGIALLKRFEFDQAADHFQRTIELGTEVADAHFRIAGIRRYQKRLNEAIEHYRLAIRARDDFTGAHHYLADVLRSQGEIAEALKHYRRALSLSPKSMPLRNSVAWILATHADPGLRQAEEALRIARRAAAETNHANPSVLDTLAAALANAGRFEEAAETAGAALVLLTSPGQDALRKQIQARLELYQRGEAYREGNE